MPDFLLKSGGTMTGSLLLEGNPTTPDMAANKAYVDTHGGGGSGSVTSVSVVTANGISGSVATATTTPAITLTLGAITPSTVNGITISTLPTLAMVLTVASFRA